jgi:hypothetical protein
MTNASGSCCARCIQVLNSIAAKDNQKFRNKVLIMSGHIVPNAGLKLTSHVYVALVFE